MTTFINILIGFAIGVSLHPFSEICKACVTWYRERPMVPARPTPAPRPNSRKLVPLLTRSGVLSDGSTLKISHGFSEKSRLGRSPN